MHLNDAGEGKRLKSLLLDPQWMQEKLSILAATLPLIEDYRTFGEGLGPAAKLTGQALELMAAPLARDERQLLAQLIGRMRMLLAA